MKAATPVAAVQARIVLVEDEALIALDLKQRLQRLGYAVVATASTADEALRLAARHSPDLILMDIHLKGEKDGIRAAAEISKTLDVPVVYLTAHSDILTLERAKITGPFGYITKPFETADLRAQIEVALARHETEQRLRRSEAWLSTTLRNIGEGVIATDLDGRVEFMNPVAERLTGWSLNSATGEPASKVFGLVDPATSAPVADPALAVIESVPEAENPGLGGEFNLRSRSGLVSLIHMAASANRAQDGELLGSVIAFRDITGQRELERRAGEGQKMETVAIMAGGLAHDFNNMLTIILGYAELAQSNPEKTAGALDAIRRAGTSASVLCKQLLTISRNDVVPTEMFDLNEPILAAGNSLRQVLGSACTLVEQPCSESLPVASCRGHIQQILINLAANARDAMPRGGTLTIATHRKSSGVAEIHVTDTGIGMTEETRRRVFEPFVSRSGPRGMGLGMTMVHSVVSRWGGTIAVKSTPGRGTEFLISFPLAEMPAGTVDQNRGTQAKDPDSAVSGSVLLVEDDAGILNLLRTLLEASGLRVFQAASGDAALLFARLNQEPIDILITDVVMPGITGPDLAKRWVDKWPETQVVFMSGYSEDELRDNELLQSGRAEFIAKPFNPGDLISVVRRRLANLHKRG